MPIEISVPQMTSSPQPVNSPKLSDEAIEHEVTWVDSLKALVPSAVSLLVHTSPALPGVSVEATMPVRIRTESNGLEPETTSAPSSTSSASVSGIWGWVPTTNSAARLPL